jgi:hypothetical protein
MLDTLDPSLYPAIYRASIWKGAGRVVIPLFLLILSILGRGQILRVHSFGVIIFDLVLAIGIIIIFINISFARVILYPDRIERLTWFSKKTMRRSDVKGVRRYGLQRIPALVPKSEWDRPFQLPSSLKRDAAWDAWMTVAVDLDKQSKEEGNTQSSTFG